MGGEVAQVQPLKLHISPCPNDTFMFDALINGRIDTNALHFEVEFHDIEELNSAALHAVADISKISCALLPHIENEYSLLRSGAALGRGNGPLLVRRKAERSPLNRVAIPGTHTTAAALMRRLHPQAKELCPMLFSEIAEAVERGEFDAGVLIHEGRFVYSERNLELIDDLGLLWEERTHLPLPLGGIVMRRSLDRSLQLQVEGLIRQSIEYAFANPSASRQFIKQHAQELDDNVIDSHIALFVNQYSLEIGEQGDMALLELLHR
ncbi:MAG: 1,4-dihydroxy-6-naphthoate synthase [Rikenellaceae bacterium]